MPRRIPVASCIVFTLAVSYCALCCKAQNAPGYPGERIRGREAWLTVAACQMEPHIADKQFNLGRMGAAVEKAADLGATVIVLPELANTGYVFNSREEAFSLGEPIPGGETVRFLEKTANRLGVYICSGMSELDQRVLYNTSVLIGPTGYIGKYRKLHLWDEEKLFFEHGDLGLPVFDLPFGRVGMFICYDGWFPETTRILRLQGVDIALNPTNWTSSPDETPQERLLAPDMHSAFAHCNSMFIVSSDRIGTERGTTFSGLSNIAGPRGTIKRASWDREEIITADVNVVQARFTTWTKFADVLKDRRVDVYEVLLGYEGVPNPRVW